MMTGGLSLICDGHAAYAKREARSNDYQLTLIVRHQIKGFTQYL